MNLQQAVKFHQIYGNVTPAFRTISRIFNEKNQPLLIRMRTFFLVVSKTVRNVTQEGQLQFSSIFNLTLQKVDSAWHYFLLLSRKS